MKKILIILLLILLTTGCTSYTELNDLGIVSILGIDYNDNKYEIYVGMIEGEQDDGTLDKQYKTYSSKGTTLDEAFQNIYIQSSKKVYLSHIDLLIVTENTINYCLKDIINNFLNNNEYRNNFNMVITKDLKEILENNIPADEINKLITINQQESGTTSSIDFETFLKNILIDKNSYLPYIDMINEETIKATTIKLIKDYKIFDTLSEDQTILFNLLNNKIKKAKYHNIHIYENEILFQYRKNEIIIKVQSTIDKNKEEYQTTLKKELKELIIYYLEKDYDLIKLKHKLYQNNYRYYKTHQNDILKHIKLNIIIKINIKNNYLEQEFFNE